MTPEQLENLQSILVNEKKQLQAIDKKYAEDIESLGQEESIEKTAEERRSKREDRLQKESAAEEKESTAIEDVLEQIDSL